MLARRALARRVPIALLVGALGVFAAATEVGFSLEENVGLSWLFRLRGPLPPPPGVAIVRLDNESVRSLQDVADDPTAGAGELPGCAGRHGPIGGLDGMSTVQDLPRTIEACAVDALTKAGAATIVFDVVFRPSPEREAGVPALAAAMRHHGRVVLAARVERRLVPSRADSALAGGKALQGVVSLPDPDLQAAAAGVATFALPKVGALVHQVWLRNDIFADPVQLPLRALEVRALDALAAAAGDHVPAAGLSTAERSQRLVAWLLQAPEAALSALPAADRELASAVRRAHLGPDHLYLNFFGAPGRIPNLSLADLLHVGPQPAQLDLAGKTVFVGRMDLDASDADDHFPTVFRDENGVDLSGVEIAATAYADLLENRPIRALPEGLRLLLVFALGAGLTLLACSGTVWRGFVLALAGGAAYAAITLGLFARGDLWLPLIVPAALLVIAVIMGQIVHYEGLAHWFAAYVPPRLARHLLRGNDSSTRARTVEVTAMFTDLVASTVLARQLGPARMAEVVNGHFEMLQRLVEAEGGMRSQIMGDGTLTFWGAPDPVPDHARRACRAALAIARAVREDNGLRRLRGEPELRLRIGLNTGLAAAGNIGGREHSAYTLTGNTVNVAARIEKQAKFVCTDPFEVAILLSQATLRAAGEGFVAEELGQFELSGIDEPMRIFRLRGLADASRLPRVAALLVGLFLTAPGIARAACPPAEAVARIETLSGDVTIDKVTVVERSLPQPVCAGQVVHTGVASRASIYLTEAASRFQLDQSSEVLLQAPPAPESGLVDLLRGALFLLSEVRRSLDIRTAYATANILGTEVLVRVADTTEIAVFDGSVGVGRGTAPTAASLPDRKIASGERVAVGGSQSGPITALPGADGRHGPLRVAGAHDLSWTLYYPPILGDRPQAGSPALREAARLLQAGRATEAQALLAGIPDGSGDAPTRDALRAVIAVAQGDPQAGLQLADAAAKRAPGAAAPLLARSYAQQALADLEQARASARAATVAEPDNAAAWARLAELELSFGDSRAARQAADRAVALAPTALARVVQGFAALSAFDAAAAERSFQAALEQDSEQPLGHLGLGLARIRKGSLADGRQQIEIATALDPTTSILRSYLGKAYFDERRDAAAGKQLAIAKDLNPDDPTPWLYDAIRKQLDNQPIEALHDIQQSIALNDNRATFRSSLLLDQDAAVRAVGLGHVYQDLGFQPLGEREAANAIEHSPSSFAAHRFLSDLYVGQPRLDVARVSELLQSQLLEPAQCSGRAAQPRHLRPQHHRDDRTGAGRPQRVRAAVPTRRCDPDRLGAVGSNDTFGNELIGGYQIGRAAISAGQLHSQSDGFRFNNDFDNNVYNVLGQAALTPQLGVQAEFRKRESDQGDLELRLLPGVSPNRNRIDETTGRLGAHYELTPGSDLISSFIYTDRDDQTIDREFGLFDSKEDDHGFQLENQHILQLAGDRLRTGVSLYRFDVSRTIDFASPDTHANRDFYSAYSYWEHGFADNITGTLGLSAERYEQGEFEKSRLNPKLGIEWRPTPQLKLRAAAFRDLKRALAADQTIEPTQVAGVNQFYDDFNATEIEQLTTGADLQVTANLAVGVELTTRSLSVPIEADIQEDPLFTEDERENWASAYAAWTPTDRWAVSAQYRYRTFDRDNSFAGDTRPLKLKTNLMPVEVQYFHPSGWFAGLGSLLVVQDGDFETDNGNELRGDTFMTFSANVGMRLPRRLGIVSFEIDNIFDTNFDYQDENFLQSETRRSPLTPERTFLLRGTLAF